MKGEVIRINSNNREMITVKTENSSIVVIELIGHEVELGDIISGNLEDLGGEILYNLTQEEKLDVYIQKLY